MSTNGTTPAQLEADIERQRRQLAATVSQLQAKLDVRSRAQHRAADMKDRVTTASGRLRPDLTLGAVALVVVALTTGLVVWRRRH
jgi:hypothetical protein